MEDAEWAFFEPFLIAVRGRGGRPASDHRRVLDAIFWIARTGSPWRDLPEEFGKWSSVYRQFRRWTLAGLWDLVLDALNDSGASPGQVQMIDSTIIRAHHLAAGAKGGPQKEGFGRSKGGFTTKIHLIANAHGLPVRAEISGGEVSDFKGFDALVDDDLPEAKVFIADRGYDSDHIRRVIEKRSGAPVIPGKINRREPILVDAITYALRNRVERCFNKLKCSRRLATRYDKTAASYLGFVHIAAARLWLRSLST
ncbi:MAG: IS5 family transposase [Roseitalea sp.]|nr:IS5 family transposase [Roseitalea sp.]MBO6951430.1 IS5 family transposase [Rhizobiaceae bacterium]MBO6592723.1 IS5 family transposase [Roseitalea sp.]MBO6598978.1 IS5 family transposase [Roseitalea sp.]MBO6611425.1 IS5 family transposase [Roseitalea sp.]